MYNGDVYNDEFAAGGLNNSADIAFLLFQVGRVIQIYKDMTSRGVSPNVTTFNCLISAATEADAASALQEIGSYLDVASTEVRAQCMNAYVTGLVKLKLWNEALSRFHSMLSPSSPTHPSAATFNAIMNEQIQRGDFQAAIRTFDDMRASGVTPTIVAYNTLLSAQAGLGAWSEALDTLHVVLSSAVDGVHPNLTTCKCKNPSPVNVHGHFNETNDTFYL